MNGLQKLIHEPFKILRTYTKITELCPQLNVLNTSWKNLNYP